MPFFDFIKDTFVYNATEPLIFTQSIFWAFFGAIILIYAFIYNKITARNVFLTAFSLFFYYKSGGYFFTLLLFSTVLDYYVGKWMHRTEAPTKRKVLLIVSLVINLGLLFYFKYAYFFTDSINHLFGTNLKAIDYLALWTNNLWGSAFEIDKIILPVGISFYTFQTLSYTIDIYRKELEPAKSILDFAFFVTFFPQLVAGPIVRAADFLPQINQKYQVSKEEYGRAIFLILNGLVKKIFISDYISANFVDRVFESPTSYSGFENLMAVYGYTIQIYCDFSGYTDIAIGLSLLLGFRLTLNFDSPYKADSITDFWRRWHISLSTWLRDYLYIPLGGNRKGKVRTYINLMLTMLLGGLWHGAHIKFIIWGYLHGVGLAVHKIWMQLTKQKQATLTGPRRFLGQIITFHFVAFCWIFFRAENMEIVRNVLLQIGTSFQWQAVGEVILGYKEVFGLMLLAYIIHWLPSSWKNTCIEMYTQVPDLAKAVVIVAVIVVLYQVKNAAIQPFIYFQF